MIDLLESKWIYPVVINLLTFLCFAIDKWKAVHGKWRIREFTLMGLSALGGAAGGLVAMYMFRHKTKKAGFRFGIPIMLIIQIAALAWLCVNL